jgi:hypothetical protein
MRLTFNKSNTVINLAWTLAESTAFFFDAEAMVGTWLRIAPAFEVLGCRTMTGCEVTRLTNSDCAASNLDIFRTISEVTLSFKEKEKPHSWIDLGDKGRKLSQVRGLYHANMEIVQWPLE